MKRPAFIPRPKPERRRPANDAEGQLFDELTADGWEVMKRGWPDFVAVRNGKVLIIEVKPGKHDRPKVDQEFVMQLLADHGLNVALWNPKSGFRRYMPTQVAPPTQ